MQLSIDHELCLFFMLKISYSENELIGKSRNDQLFFAFILKEQWNSISCSLEMSNWKDVNIAWNASGTQARCALSPGG